MASGSFTKKSGSGKDFDPLGLAAKPENDFLSPSFAASKPKKEESKFAPKHDKQETKLTSLANLPNPLAGKKEINVGFDDDGWGDADWNFDDLDKKEDAGLDIDITDKHYQNRDLNKLSDWELAHEKKKMDKKFDENFVKPGDLNFVYDKVVDFKKKREEEKP